MKRKILSVAIIFIMMVGLIVMPAQAATEEEIEESIIKGVEWLAMQQSPDGSWNNNYEAPVAQTGFALVKLCDRAYELARRPDSEIDGPFDPDYPYHENVELGLNYLFSQAAPAGVGICFEFYRKS